MRSISEQVLEPQFGSHGNTRPPDEPVPAGVLDLDLSQVSPAENNNARLVKIFKLKSISLRRMQMQM